MAFVWNLSLVEIALIAIALVLVVGLRLFRGGVGRAEEYDA